MVALLGLKVGKSCTRCGVQKFLSEFSPCKKNGDGRHAWCRKCFCEYMKARTPRKERKRLPPEEALARRRQAGLRWYYANRDRLLAERRETLFSEAERKRRQQYYAENPEIFRRAGRRRTALKRGATGYIEHIDPLVVLEMDDGMCGICGRDLDPHSFEVDHIFPLSRGGSHVYSNVQATHSTCNRRKYNRLPEEVAA